MSQSSKHLSCAGLLSTVSDAFEKLDKKSSKGISLRDCLLSGLAVFGLKSSSLLQFDKEAHDTSSAIRANLINLYKVKQVPCDTYLRERLDDVDPKLLRKAPTFQFKVQQNLFQPQTLDLATSSLIVFLVYYLLNSHIFPLYTTKKVEIAD